MDVLFANAGVAFFAPAEQSDEAFFDHLFDVNVKGAFYTVQKAIPLLAPGASVILTGSSVTEVGFEGASVYAATKGAVRSLTRTFARELLPRKVRVNNLSPGPIETPIFARTGIPADALEQMAHGIAQQVPLGRFGAPDEIARAALFLASDDSSFVLGVDLFADGGMTQL